MRDTPLIALLTDFGQSDAYVGTMKGIMLGICPQARLVDLILRETPTLGVRYQVLSRAVAGREIREVETPWGTVRVKVKLLAGRPVAAAPEYDDCARLAAGAGVPLAQVMEAARRAARPV